MEVWLPFAAPSANLFGRPSPTTSQHVLDDLRDRIDMIIDGGRTNVGVESTVLDLTQEPYCILRPGGITLEELKEVSENITIFKENSQDIFSPGMYPYHYSPRAKVILVEGDDDVQTEKVRSLAYEFTLRGYSIGIMAREENKDTCLSG